MNHGTQFKIGGVIKEGDRDAVHIAVLPVLAHSDMEPGMHIGFKNGFSTFENPIGIVDPFLKKVNAGEKFYLFLYPNTITSLRHVWIHPDIPSEIQEEVVEKNTNPSKEWIENFAGGLGLSYEEIMDAAEEYVEHGEYFVQGGRFEGEYVPDEFWPHYESVTGKKVAEKDKGSFFSCSC
jgi:hypothetical protein